MRDVNKILFITLSNIGDVVLTLPALDALRQQYPRAKISVICGLRAKEIFAGAPFIEKVIVFEKRAALREKIRLFNELKKEKFDAVIDLRNSLFGLGLPAKYKLKNRLPADMVHMKDRHLYKVASRLSQVARQKIIEAPRESLYISPSDEVYIENLLRENNIGQADKFIVIAPGSRSHTKKWAKEKFAELIIRMAREFRIKVTLAGDKDDLDTAGYIEERCRGLAINLCAKTTLRQLAYLLKKSSLLITNDSAVLHIASYLDIPVVAVFGITSEAKYGPWSEKRRVVKKDIFCRPCEEAQCRLGSLKCMQLVNVEDVLRAVREILGTSRELGVRSYKNDFKRILVVRTDRIGDVLLSTPVIKALRDYYPDAYIAAMVSPYAKEVVEGNPNLDGVIIYDKEHKHKKWRRSIKFALNLKKKRFDLAIVLHPTNRVHLVTFLAGIPKRVGYDRKLGFLLTDRIKHTKQLGEKHELEYALDLVRYLGIEPRDKNLFIPIKPVSEEWVEELFKQQGVSKSDRLLAIHPGASCISKLWPLERFTQVADRLIEKYGFKILIIAGPKDIVRAQEVSKNMHHPSINLAGKTSVSQLASLLKRCQLFISNDSGPVHIACAVGAPVISIFGRNQKGLSPTRWGPTGKNARIAHKAVGCIECRAHNCIRSFVCLKAVTVDYVLNIADSILQD